MERVGGGGRLKKTRTFDLKFLLVLIVFLVFLYLSITYLPQLIVKYSLFNISDKEQIGNSFSSFVGTLVAMVAAFLTFIAFWVQYKANLQQWQSIQIDRVENRIFNMLDIHRQNVNELFLKDFHNNVLEGRNIFPHIFNEFKRTYEIVRITILGKEKETLESRERISAISYIIFFIGIKQENKSHLSAVLKKYFSDDDLIKEIIHTLEEKQSADYLDAVQGMADYDFYKENFKYQHFNGYLTSLGHYYRHLFQMVKYIDEHPSDILSDIDKYNYIKTIRAQLSDYEQLLLYYSSLFPPGESWIENGYLIKYKLIKNLPLALADFGINPKEKFSKDIAELKKEGIELFEWEE